MNTANSTPNFLMYPPTTTSVWPYKPWYPVVEDPIEPAPDNWYTLLKGYNERAKHVSEEPMNNLTDITVLIDESGSMADKFNDVTGGYNSFLKEQRQLETPCKLSLITFSDRTKVLTAASDLKFAKTLSRDNYRPAGGTALLDALKLAITAAAERVQRSRPSKVIFVVFTDGEENASKSATLNEIKDLVSAKQLIGWEFVFMGADIDAFSVGNSIGALHQYTSQVVPHKLTKAYEAMSNNISMMRSGTKLDSSFTIEQQDYLSKN